MPSKIELNMERSDVKTKPMANIDFILTIIKSLKIKTGVTRHPWLANGKRHNVHLRCIVQDFNQ